MEHTWYVLLRPSSSCSAPFIQLLLDVVRPDIRDYENYFRGISIGHGGTIIQMYIFAVPEFFWPFREVQELRPR